MGRPYIGGQLVGTGEIKDSMKYPFLSTTTIYGVSDYSVTEIVPNYSTTVTYDFTLERLKGQISNFWGEEIKQIGVLADLAKANLSEPHGPVSKLDNVPEFRHPRSKPANALMFDVQYEDEI